MRVASPLRVLVIGGGGREHALCWKIAHSPRCAALYCASGSDAIAQVAERVPIAARDIEQLADWACDNAIDLTVVGPDDPLADGVVDALQARGLRAFGPTRDAAQIEWSKSWAKAFCREHGIPIGGYEQFDDADDADRYVDSCPPGLVVKADGLAVGKGAIVCRTREEAHAAIDQVMRSRAFGESGARVVIEELLSGPEVSFFAISDGATYRLLPSACDHKAVFDGDQGPNTGGMGAYSPPGWLTPAQAREIELRMVAPAIRGMAQAGRPFVGFLFTQVMMTPQGPRVIEFNARFGDPEAQAILPRLELDLLDLLDLAASGRLHETPVELPVRDEASCCVVMASPGYPGPYETGLPIEGVEKVDREAVVFHAGTRREGDHWVTAGGRVLGVTGFGADLTTARAHAYFNVKRVSFPGAHYRGDIGR